MIIRILNREWNSRLSDGTTEEFRTMTNEVTKAIDSVMQPKWPSIKVAKVTKFVKGSVIAHVTLTTTESNSPSAMKVKQLIEDQAVRGPVESLNIEPSTVKAIKTEIEEPENMTADQLRNWILIGLGVSLFLLAFCLVCCIVCRSCSRKRETFFNGGYPVQYPMNGYGYQATMVPAIEKKGFENATFQSVHTRHFSQATTASQNGKSSPNTIATTHESPKGVGETTYQEWYAKVGAA
ncbi:unnamed protein product [Anisakis simplex]|uniref:SEA domain-containing protein n=1 Tax=Anisakis simplex TaxID=6269 RepID=A0A0M3J3Q8_ANISI|nr:unnamed protein product [Anisakis simplex]